MTRRPPQIDGSRPEEGRYPDGSGSQAPPAAVPSAPSVSIPNAAHTPGPWRWVAEDCSMCTLERDSDDAEHVLSITICRNCEAHASDRGAWEWSRCYTANEANARLIASAPVLYAALAKMDAAVRALLAGTPTGDQIFNLTVASLQARAVIAKASGIGTETGDAP